MEHLAGRIAAACALKAVGVKGVPGTGDQRRRCGLSPGLAASATATPARWPSSPPDRLVSTSKTCSPRAGDGAGEQYYQPDRTHGAEGERTALRIGSDAGFSAKESGFKALPLTQQSGTGFMHFRITDIQGEVVTLWTEQQMYLCIGWRLSPASSRFAKRNTGNKGRTRAVRAARGNAMLAQHIVFARAIIAGHQNRGAGASSHDPPPPHIRHQEYPAVSAEYRYQPPP